MSSHSKRPGAGFRAGWACLAAAALWCPPAIAAGTWGGSLALTTNYVFRGVMQGGRGAAVQADVHGRTPTGWFAGAWISSLDPPAGTFGSSELNLYAGSSWPLTERSGLSLRLVHYAYPGSPLGRRYDADELSASLQIDDRLVLSLAGSPNTSRYVGEGWALRRRTLAYEAALRQPIGPGWALVASAGYYDTQALYGSAYRAWALGLAGRLGPLDANLSRFATDAAARRLFGSDSAQGRWAFSLAWRY